MKIYKATYFDNATPVIRAVNCIKMDGLYFYTEPTDDQIQRYNSTKIIRHLLTQNNGVISHHKTRQEAIEHMDKFMSAIVEKQRRVYETLKNRHLDFLSVTHIT